MNSHDQDLDGQHVIPLLSFLDAAQRCAQESLNSNAVALSRCAELDSFINSSASSRVAVPVAAILRMNARAMFGASINTATIGYRAGLFPTLRACLEAACYAQEVEITPGLTDVWLNRHRSNEDRKISRKAFGGAVSNTCRRLGILMPDNSGLVSRMYDAMIDDGAHPNVRSILPSIRVSDTEERYELSIGMVVPQNVEYSLFCCYEIGLFTSWLMTDLDVYDEEFWREAARLNEVKNEWERELIEMMPNA